ncbi:MAG: hypothetical protein SFU99_05065 [Saprospiraceae bacterium]|nr:hypothetical protein [Saprospiraceae bacterium]
MEALQIVIPWLFALASLVFSFYSLKMTRRNSELDRKKVILSGNRQEWINTLRNSVAELLSLHSLLILSLREKMDDYQNLKDVIKQTVFLQHKIDLLLNPSEQDSQELMKKIWQLNAASRGEMENSEDDVYLVIQNEITRLTQKILKTEWERVKKIE